MRRHASGRLHVVVVLVLALSCCLSGCGFFDDALEDALSHKAESADEPAAVEETSGDDEPAEDGGSDDAQPPEVVYRSTGIIEDCAGLPTTGVWYESLDEEQRNIYDLLLEPLRRYEGAIEVPACDEERLWQVLWAIEYDHPELFWLTDGYDYLIRRESLTVMPKRAASEDEMLAVWAQIKQAADEALAGLDPNASTYQKVQYCYDWMLDHVSYEEGVHDQTVEGVFVDQRVVCAGYTRGFQFLCQRLGIPCDMLAGMLNDGDSHSWNIVWIDGTPTCVDVTAGDAEDAALLPGEGRVYDYLCLTAAELNQDRTIDEHLTQLPVCDSAAYDYYHLTGTFMEEFDVNALATMIAQASANGSTTLRFKLGSDEAYAAAADFVLTQDVYSLMPSYVTRVSTVRLEQLHILGLSWE